MKKKKTHIMKLPFVLNSTYCGQSNKNINATLNTLRYATCKCCLKAKKKSDKN